MSMSDNNLLKQIPNDYLLCCCQTGNQVFLKTLVA